MLVRTGNTLAAVAKYEAVGPAGQRAFGTAPRCCGRVLPIGPLSPRVAQAERYWPASGREGTWQASARALLHESLQSPLTSRLSLF